MGYAPVLCAGILRSGSTWSFNVCRLIMKIVAQREQATVESGYMPAAQADELLQSRGGDLNNLIVIKMHGMGPHALELTRAGKAKTVCTFRDPRDCVASLMTFAGDTFEQAVERLSHALPLLAYLIQSERALLIRYEEMMGDRVAMIARIAAYLSVQLSEAELAEIDAATSPEESIRICQSLETRPSEAVWQSMDHRVDPETWLHDNHMQNGTWGRWREELSLEQQRELDVVFARWIEGLGYPVKAVEAQRVATHV